MTQPQMVYALAASPTFAQDGLCFAGRTTGLARSEDGGLTWQDAYQSLELTEPLATISVAVSPGFAQDRQVFAGVSGGVLRSVDGGHNWYVAPLPSPPPLVLSLVVSPNFAQDGVLLAGTMEDGIFRSADRGQSWAAWNFGLLDLNVLCLAISPAFAEDETLFAGTDSGIFRSTNGGRAWREVDFSPDLAPVLSLALSANYADDNTLFAGTEAHGLFCSRDGGQSWTRLAEEAIQGAVNRIVLSPQYPASPHLLILLGDSLLVSYDQGHSWSEWPHFDGEAGAVAAPQGLEPGSPLLVGLLNGQLMQL